MKTSWHLAPETHGTTHKSDAHAGRTCASHVSTPGSEVMPFIQRVCVSTCFTHKHSTVNTEKRPSDSQLYSVVLSLPVPLNCYFFFFSAFFAFFPGRSSRSAADCSGELSQSKYLNLGTHFKALGSFLTRAVVKATRPLLRSSEMEVNSINSGGMLLLLSELLINHDWLIAVWGRGLANQTPGV